MLKQLCLTIELRREEVRRRILENNMAYEVYSLQIETS